MILLPYWRAGVSGQEASLVPPPRPLGHGLPYEGRWYHRPEPWIDLAKKAAAASVTGNAGRWTSHPLAWSGVLPF